jgi:cyanate permease
MRWLVLAGVWGLYTSFGLVATSIAPLVPLIEADLGLSHAAMGSIMGAWQLVYIGAAIPCGMLLDRLGSRRALAIGVAAIAASSLGRSFADDYATFLLSVMIFGIGGPIISAGAPKVVTEWFQGSTRGFAMGVYTTGPAIGSVVSLTLTHSVLIPLLGDWREVLRLFSLVAAAAGVFWLLVSSLPAARAGEARDAGERARPQLAATQELFALPAVRLLLAMSVGTFMFSHGLANWLPELLHAGGMPKVEAGYWSAIPTAVGIGAALLIPRLATPKRRFSLLLGLVGAACLSSLLMQFDHRTALFSGLFLQGVARSTLMTVLILTLVELPGIGDRRAGTATGLFFAAAEVGGVLGPLGLGVLYDATGGFSAGLGFLTLTTAVLALGVVHLERLATRAAAQGV